MNAVILDFVPNPSGKRIVSLADFCNCRSRLPHIPGDGLQQTDLISEKISAKRQQNSLHRQPSRRFRPRLHIPHPLASVSNPVIKMASPALTSSFLAQNAALLFSNGVVAESARLYHTPAETHTFGRSRLSIKAASGPGTKIAKQVNVARGILSTNCPLEWSRGLQC